MATIYVVMGRTGEYGNQPDWPVAAFLVEEAANTLAEKLNAWCAKHGCHTSSPRPRHCSDECPDDPNFSASYTGTNYHIVSIPLRG